MELADLALNHPDLKSLTFPKPNPLDGVINAPQLEVRENAGSATCEENHPAAIATAPLPVPVTGGLPTTSVDKTLKMPSETPSAQEPSNVIYGEATQSSRVESSQASNDLIPEIPSLPITSPEPAVNYSPILMELAQLALEWPALKPLTIAKPNPLDGEINAAQLEVKEYVGSATYEEKHPAAIAAAPVPVPVNGGLPTTLVDKTLKMPSETPSAQEPSNVIHGEATQTSRVESSQASHDLIPEIPSLPITNPEPTVDYSPILMELAQLALNCPDLKPLTVAKPNPLDGEINAA
ncbi:hypothetical protein HDU67_005262, partial [Dinochytrium kinnereticum]